MLLLIIFVALSGYSTLYLTGCASGPSDPSSTSTIQITTVYGRVVDETGNAVMGASVTCGTGATAMTDANGFYIIKNTTITSGRALALAKKVGYFTAAKAELPYTTGSSRVDLTMMSNAATATVASATLGGTVTIAAGGSIVFAPGSFTDASGNPYTGAVRVAARYLDPKTKTFFDYFSGDDMAQTTDGKTTSLISCGVLRVELKDPSGNALKLDATKPATLSFPKAIDPNAPAVMPLWYFDETLGMWKEEGFASLSGGMYTGTVKHFSDWNLDYKDSTGYGFSSANVSLRVVCNGVPVAGVAVSIVGDDAAGKYFVHAGAKTGPDGRIHFLRYPYNRKTQINIDAAKNGGTFYINAPIDVQVADGENKDIGDISLNSPCPASVSGTIVGCDDKATEGLVTITVGVNNSYVYTKDGKYAVQAASGSDLTINAMDVNGNLSNTLTVPALTSGEARNLDPIKVCGSATSTFIDITVGAKESQAIALSPDGSKLALYTISGFNVYDAKTGAMLSTGTFTGQNYVNSMQFSTDNNKLLLSSSYGGGAMLYDVSTTTASSIIKVAGVSGSVLSDDGAKIIALLAHGSGVDPDLNIYDATNGNVMQTLHPSNINDSVYSFGYDRDENAIIYADTKNAGIDRVWSIASNSEIRNFTVAGSPYSFFSSEDGLTVVATNDYKLYSCYATKTGVISGKATIGGTNGTRYGNPILTKNNIYVVDQVSGANVVRVIKIADGSSMVKLLSGTNYVAGIAASRNEHVLAASSNSTIRIWQLQ